MATTISTTARNAAANSIATLADAGSGAAVVKVYTGSKPASADTGATGTLLITFTLSDPSFGAASTGTITAASMPKSANAVASGTAGYARLEDSAGNSCMDGDVGTTGTAFIISSTAITSGNSYSLTALTVAVPAS